MGYNEENRRINKQDRADPKLLFMQQVTRCLQTTGDPTLYDANVEGLFRMLPTASYLILSGREDEWSQPIEKLVYKQKSTRKMGTENNPVCWDEDHFRLTRALDRDGVIDSETAEVDWTHPDIVSPYLKVVDTPDYQELFRLILTEAQDCGIWWSDGSGGVINLPSNIRDILKATKDLPRTPL